MSKSSASIGIRGLDVILKFFRIPEIAYFFTSFINSLLMVTIRAGAAILQSQRNALQIFDSITLRLIRFFFYWGPFKAAWDAFWSPFPGVNPPQEFYWGQSFDEAGNVTADVSYTDRVCSEVDAMKKHLGCSDSFDRETRETITSEEGTLASYEQKSLFSLYHSFIAHYLRHITTSEVIASIATVNPAERMASYLISRWSIPESTNKNSTSCSSSGEPSVSSTDTDESIVDRVSLSDSSIGEWVSSDGGNTFFALIPTNYLMRISSSSVVS
jgi:hypothetical protein